MHTNTNQLRQTWRRWVEPWYAAYGLLGATLGAVPSAPTNLTAQVVLNAVTLAWTPASGDVLAYRIEAGSASGALFDRTAPPPLVKFIPSNSLVLLPAAVSIAMTGPNGWASVRAS